MERCSRMTEPQQEIGSDNRAPPQLYQQTMIHQYTEQTKNITRCTNEKPIENSEQKQQAKHIHNHRQGAPTVNTLKTNTFKDSK